MGVELGGGVVVAFAASGRHVVVMVGDGPWLMLSTELATAVQSGQSIADVAAAEGVDVQVVIDALVTEAEARIAQGVTDGRFTLEEADAKLRKKWLPVEFEVSEFQLARWVSSDDRKKLEAFIAANGSGIADDVDGDPVFMAKNEFYLGYTRERAEGINFSNVKDVKKKA